MASERWRQVEALYHSVLERDASTRDQFLKEQCSTDPELREEVESLLRHGGATPAFFDRPVADPTATRPEPLLISAPAETYQITELPGASGASGSSGFVRARNAEDDFPGTDRFTVIRRLGAGAVGVVYEVQDRVRHEIVALKTLRHTTPAGIYRLKQEFRGLAGITHPNIVCLYELVVDDARCFFTMELVNGVNFVDYVRGRPDGRLSTARLVPALRQLITGVSTLHRFGKLHRDIKPSNVLVTPDGRVVILDFGLLTELFPDAFGATEPLSGGTPAYLPPEAASGMPPSEAGDWYSVGATLYSGLTGQVPFKGPLVQMLLHKSQSDPPPPADIAPDVPADLSALCMELMCRDPSRRLSGRDALIRLGGEETAPPLDQTSDPIGETSFVGRARELAQLDEAFRQVVDGRSSAVFVHGPSGIGKSALVRSFLGRLTMQDEVVVLSGRCYEHESLPYKALDGVVDNLSRYIVSLPQSVAESVLPTNVAALARLFPVMLRVPAIAQASRDREPPATEPLVLRRMAFEALRELLSRLATHRRLVIYIDDLQWSDVDGALLLEDLLREPGAPALLTVVSFRSEEVAANPFLRKLIDRRGDTWTSLSLEPMGDAEAGELIRALAREPLNDQQRHRITAEAGGNPFFLEQLARYAGTTDETVDHGPTFGDMFDARVRRLPDMARAFLHTLVVCGRPMAPELVCEASGLSRDARPLVASLRSAHFIRSSGSSERVEPYHDRIREALAAQVSPPETRRIHGSLAETLVASGVDDPEALFDHYRGADDRERASIQAVRAAERARAALAFDRAALFFSHALALNPASPAALEWKEGRARALADAGRPAEAAEAYLHASTEAISRRRVELQQRGAEQFLIGGHIDRGLDLVRTVLASVGIAMPRTPAAALLLMLWYRARLRWRGLEFVSRRADNIDAGALLRVDTCWSAVTGLLLVDMISAGYFSVRHLLLALDAGEPTRIARAMAIEATANTAYPTGRKLAEKLLERSTALAKSAGHQHAIALSLLGESITAMATGRWKTGGALAEKALHILRDQRTGVTWEVNIAENMVIWALMYQGELGEVCRRVPTLLANARSTGNLYIATELCTRSNYVWLAADEPDQGEREAIESIERWSHKGFHRQHYSALLARVQTALYRGNAEQAWRLFAEHEPRLRRSLITHLQVVRVEARYMRARSALALASKDGGSRRFLSVARADARRIAREHMPWSDPIALLLMAGVAYVEGDARLALAHLHNAVDQFERADMNLYAAITRRRIAALQHDGLGYQLQRQADEWMAAQNIKNPAGFTRMLAPGLPDLT